MNVKSWGEQYELILKGYIRHPEDKSYKGILLSLYSSIENNLKRFPENKELIKGNSFFKGKEYIDLILKDKEEIKH